VQRITSRQNPIVTRFRAAARGDDEAMLLDGTHLVGEALTAGIRLEQVLVDIEAAAHPEIEEILGRLPHAVQVAEGSAGVMDAASPVRSSSAIVALASRPARATDLLARPSPLVVVLCDIQDPGNVGAILRVTEAAGAHGAILTGQTADPFGWKALRGSMGSALRLPLQFVPDAADVIAAARAHQVHIVATVPRDGVPLFDSDLSEATALFIGGEGPGLPQSALDAADVRVTIPMEPPVESLNASVAAAVLLYEARRQRARPLAAT